MSRAVVIGLALHLLGAGALAGTATPEHHGEMVLTPAGGRIVRRTGVATMKVRQWVFTLSPTTDGVSPDTEPLVIQVGDNSTWRLEPGMLKRSKKGDVWTYKPAGKLGTRAVKSLRLKRDPDGALSVRFVLTGVDASQLNIEDPVCFPFAFIIGNDDGFTGIQFTSPSFFSSRLIVPKDRCEAQEWPWA